MKRGLVLSSIALMLYCGVCEYREIRARSFCDSFIPLLAVYYDEHGRYPDALPAEWYPGSGLPSLVRPDFYLPSSDRQGFLVRFVNPQRPSFDNVVAYQSDIEQWASWDGY